MEADNNTAPVPEIEQDLQDTPTTNDNSFNDMLGLPNTTEETAPPKHEDTQQLIEKEVAPQQDFSNNQVPNDNDQVRYQYWQSQAAKLQNELQAVKDYAPMVDYLRNNPEAVQNLTPGGKAPEGQVPQSQEPEEFPPPPAKPEQPAGFSREEAFSDPASASAQHLDEVEKWRDDMQQYNQLASQYEIAVMRENYNQKLDKFEKLELERKAYADNAKKMNDVRHYVNSNYDLGDSVDDFINTMNDPSSLNMDELVAYYKFKKGMVAPTNVNNATAPSSNFQQVKRAQSVPTPMGVQPAQSNAPTDASEGFMDLLINNDKHNNIL